MAKSSNVKDSVSALELATTKTTQYLKGSMSAEGTLSAKLTVSREIRSRPAWPIRDDPPKGKKAHTTGVCGSGRCGSAVCVRARIRQANCGNRQSPKGAERPGHRPHREGSLMPITLDVRLDGFDHPIGHMFGTTAAGSRLPIAPTISRGPTLWRYQCLFPLAKPVMATYPLAPISTTSCRSAIRPEPT